MSKQEIFMILAGLLLLASLPFFQGNGFYVWLVAKGFYGAGVIAMWTSNH